ncbi:GNAT family N-acetyltransferase [Solihabitans fulvus]|uniref:GNAT family N-acetyltransferase n=1 Tax=Solihabitans fulvus TaxID=1892852 RepID=A0A5B2X5W0_9PSEU|nr:GNAT family N-acetyltransferase [Solihabitans fulvus]KAA2258585.1 GNAT family N-acetyltransferase [Solihabitans fulvus]
MRFARPGWVGSVERMAISWRPLTEADVPAMALLVTDADAVDRTGERAGESELTRLLTGSAVSAADSTLAAVADGRLVAFAAIPIRQQTGEVHRVRIVGQVHPDWRGRGIGRELLRWQVDRAKHLAFAAHPELPLELHVHVDSRNDAQRALLFGEGFRAAREFATMRAPLPTPTPPQSAVPTGLRLIDYVERHDEATRLALNEAFLDHWGHRTISAQDWRSGFTDMPSFRPALSTLALDERTGEVAGFVLGFEYDAATERTGVREINLGHVGTRRPWRRRGLAAAMVGRVLAAAGAAGFGTAGLSVDTDNPNGAPRVYRRAGFEVVRRWHAMVLAVSPQPLPRTTSGTPRHNP